MSARRGTADGRRQAVSASLYVGNPASAARPPLVRDVPGDACPLTLPVEEIYPYDGNPRRAPNEKYGEIKASIAVSGIRNPITVTRRPGDSRYIVEAGGNTRLRALQELWRETRDERFRNMTVVFRPWRSESHVLVAHLIENEQRGDMSFWDKAMGIVALRRQLELEQQRTLSVRALESELKALGITVSHSLLNLYRFATERLAVLGEAVPALSGVAVARTQPRLNLLRQYARSRTAMDEDEFYAEVCQPVFTRVANGCRAGQPLDVDQLCQACEDALAQAVGDTAEQVRKAMTVIAQTGAGQSETAALDPAQVQIGDEQGAVQSRDAGWDMPPGGVAVAGTGSDGAPAVIAPVPAAPAQSGQPAAGEASPGADPVLAPAAIPRAAPVSRLRRAMAVFAQLAGVLDSVAPQSPGDALRVREWPADLSGVSREQLRAWWLLALVDATLPPDDAGAMLPAAQRGGLAACRTLAGDLCDLSLFLWLADARDEAASAWHDVMSACRSLHAADGALFTGAARNTSLPEGY